MTDDRALSIIDDERSALGPAPGFTGLTPAQASAAEKLFTTGKVTGLSADERLAILHHLCNRYGLDPANQPFMILDDSLYVTRRGTDNIRANYRISTEITNTTTMADGQVLAVTAKASLPDGRTDTATGAVPLVAEEKVWKTNQNGKRFPEPTGRVLPLSPDEYANAIMKAETKAKRRATLSLVGLGLLDESELDTMRAGQRRQIDRTTGEIVDNEPVAIDAERLHRTTGEVNTPPHQRPAPPRQVESGPRKQEDPRVAIVARLESIVSREALNGWADREHGASDALGVDVPALADLYNRLAKDLEGIEVFEATYAAIEVVS